MSTDYTWDLFSTLDGFGSYEVPEGGTGWGGYWGRQGPELLERRSSLFADPLRMVFGATTFRETARYHSPDFDAGLLDEWNRRLYRMPATILSSRLDDTSGWPDATIERGDAADIVRRLKAESDVPLRSHGSLSLNRSLVRAGEVDRIQVTVFPVVSGRTGVSPVFLGLPDLDLDLLESRVLDGHTLELTYRPRLR